MKLQESSHNSPIAPYIDAIENLIQGDYSVKLPDTKSDPLRALGEALIRLAQSLDKRYRELQQINQITTSINSGLLLDDVLDNIYEEFRGFIPYNRIGFSLIEADGKRVRSIWTRSDQPRIWLKRGYSAPLAGSSLEAIMTTGKPRIINDLAAYLEQKPESDSTRLVVQEGIRSSLTCPLIANGVPIGFIFFSSVEPNTYADAHVDIFQRIADQLSVIVEKGRLVSELAAQKQAADQRNEELRRLNEFKNTFLGMAAHDLRSPISSIQSAINLMLELDVDLTHVERQKILSDMSQQSQYMLNLLNDLLDISHIESGKFTLKLAPVKIAVAVEESISRYQHHAEVKSIRINVEPIPAGQVVADPIRLRQVLDNLLSNAIKFSPPGTTVWLRANRQPKQWRIEIQDDGPGISADDQERLFEEFARLSSRPTGNEKSTGLGLAITRRVVEALGGQIGVISESGKGSTFWFTLPTRSNDSSAQA